MWCDVMCVPVQYSARRTPLPCSTLHFIANVQHIRQITEIYFSFARGRLNTLPPHPRILNPTAQHTRTHKWTLRKKDMVFYARHVTYANYGPGPQHWIIIMNYDKTVCCVLGDAVQCALDAVLCKCIHVVSSVQFTSQHLCRRTICTTAHPLYSRYQMNNRCDTHTQHTPAKWCAHEKKNRTRSVHTPNVFTLARAFVRSLAHADAQHAQNCLKYINFNYAIASARELTD